MSTPPLVSASPPGTPRADAGVLGTPGATILFGGDNDLLNDSHRGLRLHGGGWIDCSKQIALEADWLDLRNISEIVRAESDGTDIISRPYFNDQTNVADAELVSFPGVLAGSVTVTAHSDFQSGGARLRWNMGCEDMGCGDVLRWHLLTGYRFAQLSESLIIREELESLDPAFPGTFDLHDRFRTKNEFHGAEIGSVWRVRGDRWDCELLTRLALGSVEQTVTISGDTQIDEPLVSQLFPGGLLAQRTNSGTFRRNRFAAIPEFGVTVGYRITRNLSASLGYSLIMWRNIVRPGDQIDPTVDPRLIPEEDIDPLTPGIQLATDATRPGFAFHDTRFWAQGINFGLSYRW